MRGQRMWRIVLAAFAATSMASFSGTVLAQDKPAGCIQAGAPQKVEGQIVQIEPDQGKLTVRESSGATHDFRASPETLRSYKIGDRIEAALRPGQECKKSAS